MVKTRRKQVWYVNQSNVRKTAFKSIIYGIQPQRHEAEYNGYLIHKHYPSDNCDAPSGLSVTHWVNLFVTYGSFSESQGSGDRRNKYSSHSLSVCYLVFNDNPKMNVTSNTGGQQRSSHKSEHESGNWSSLWYAEKHFLFTMIIAGSEGTRKSCPL